MVGHDGVLALPWLRPALASALQSVRGHAILVHGSPGDGAWDFGLALGQGWLCEHAEPGRRPCGQCPSCELFRGWSHPDQSWLVPQELALAREMPVQVDSKRKPSRQIRVDDVREAIDSLTRTSGRGRGQVLVAFPAEAMNAVAASALLKTLEEPPAGTRIVLCAADPARLLPTILSRCQRLELPRPTQAEALEWLDRQGIEGADTLLRASSGRPLDAARLSAQGLSAVAWKALPRRVAAGDSAALTGLGIPGALDALGKVCHDAMAVAVGGEARFFDTGDLPRRPHLGRLATWLRSLQQVQQHAEHPWNEPVLVDALLAEGREALSGG